MPSSRDHKSTIVAISVLGKIIEDRNGRLICWVYRKGKDARSHKMPSEDEALMVVKENAKMSKRKEGKNEAR